MSEAKPWVGFVALERERAAMKALGLAELVVLSTTLFCHGGFLAD